MKHELAVMIWNEFISQSLNEGCKFSFKDLENRIGEKIEELKTPKNIRYFLVSYTGEGNGSIWFNYECFPSHLMIKEAITSKFNRVKNPCILHIQEFTESDYKSFNGV